jgi:hypothetical protein
MKNDLKCDNCHAQVTPSTTNWINVHLTIFAFVDSLWSLNSASRSYSLSVPGRSLGTRHTLWKTCSRLISANRPFNSLTFATMLSIFPLSSLSILLVSPMARSMFNLTAPLVTPALLNHPPMAVAAGPEGVKHNRCSPESAAEKVNLEGLSLDVDVCVTTRWSLSKVSSTVT